MTVSVSVNGIRIRSVTIATVIAIGIGGTADAKRKTPRPADTAKDKAARAPKAAKEPKEAKAAAAKVKNVAPPGDTPSERELQADLDKVLATRLFAHSKTGLYVVDRKTGHILYSYGADDQLNPASNVKLVSTAAALDALGPDFAIPTRAMGPAADANGVVHGDAYLVGSWDFTLEEGDLTDVATSARAQGIHEITGDVVVGEDDARDVPPKAELDVTITGGAKDGALAQVTLSPDSAYFVVENDAITKTLPTRKIQREVEDDDPAPAKKGKHGKKHKKTTKMILVTAPAVPIVTVKLDDEKTADAQATPRIVVTVTGKIPPGASITVARPVTRPALFAAHTLRAALKLAGVKVDGGVRRGATPAEGLVELGRHASIPLATLVALVNKPSNNYLAQRVIEATGTQLYGGPPAADKGLRAMDAFCEKLGFDKGSYRLDNGSGYSYTNHLSAVQIARLLMTVAHDPKIGAAFVASLSIAGKDGTLKRRFAGHPSVGYVFGKTGTLTGVAALSGIVKLDAADPDDEIVFAIMTNGFANGSRKDVRAGQAAMVDAMYRYLRRRAGDHAPPPATTQPANDDDATQPDDASDSATDDEGEEKSP